MALVALAALILSACREAVSPGGSDQGGQPPVASSTGSTQQAGGIRGVRKVFDQPHTTVGKPLTFFTGGQFCPFCAAMRWPLVKARQRVGTFSGLGEMHSRPGEHGFQSIATVSSTGRCYSSFEFSGWRREAEGLARPALQLERDVVKVLLAVG